MRSAFQRWLDDQRSLVADFEQALRHPRSAQEAKLRQYLDRNQDTEFGREHGFAGISSFAEYQAAVPLRTYAELEPWIQRIAGGEPRVLTVDPVEAFEETSGSGGRSKWIPYNATLKQEYEQAFLLWASAIDALYPDAFAGKSYWSLSPPVKAKGQTASGLPIGLPSDLAYFSAETASILASTMAVSPDLASETDPDAFFEQTLDQLETSQDLSLISVWSPVAFLRLDEVLRRRGGGPKTWKERWPSLALLSCWTDAQSAVWIPEVQRRLGEVPIQGKGLLSTEGVVSIPWQMGQAPALTVLSHFYEFLDPESDEVRLADEVELGKAYEVVLTTGGGLYRYRTGDLVTFEEPCRLRFLVRAGRVSDMVGEKLSETQAIEALATVPGARFLAAESRCYLVAGAAEEDLAKVEESLRRNPYYAQARDLGQLQALEPVAISEAEAAAMLRFFAERQGCVEGDVKLPALWLQDEWSDWTRERG